MTESMVRGYPQRGIHLMTKVLAVPFAVNSGVVTENASARLLNR